MVIYSTLFTTVGSRPPANIPRVEVAALKEIPVLAEVKSPKSAASPVEAISIKSIILEKGGLEPRQQIPP